MPSKARWPSLRRYVSVAAALTSPEVDNAVQVGPLLAQSDGTVASFTGDGAYDPEGVYSGVAQLKQFRTSVTRYDRTARNFLAAIHLAASTIWLN